jgi:hypothetical protein
MLLHVLKPCVGNSQQHFLRAFALNVDGQFRCMLVDFNLVDFLTAVA